MSYIKVNDLLMYYTESGDLKKQTLILVHGIYFDSRFYRYVLSYLSTKYHVYCIDLPMHGKSESPKRDIFLKDMANYLHGFIVELKIKNPIICAHSGGALIAMEYASRYSLKKLYLHGPAGAKCYDSKFKLFWNLAIVKTIKNVLSNPIRSAIHRRFALENYFRNLFNTNYNRLLKDNLSKNHIDVMNKITCPVVLLWSEDEEVFPIKYSKVFLSNIKKCTLHKTHGGHDWMYFEPEQIKKFL